MRKLRWALVVLALVFSMAPAVARAEMIGPNLVRAWGYPTDIATNVLFVYADWAFTSGGRIDFFESYVMPGANGYGGAFDALLLRPTGAPNTYTVLAKQGFVAPNVQTATIWDYTLTTPWDVQAGDVYAHFGNGIPLNIPGSPGLPLYYPSSPSPVAGQTITVGSAPYPLFDQLRDYGLDAHVVPEPTSLLLLGTGLVGLARGWRKRRR